MNTAAFIWLLFAIADISAALQHSCNHLIRPGSAIFSGDNQSPFFADVSDKSKQSTSAEDTSEFGQSVPYIPLSQRQSTSSISITPGTNSLDETEMLRKNRTRNIIVAITSFAVSILHYIWQLAHPVTAVEILATMQSQSAPLTSIGNNGKPTVIDFWAPWCENCKVAAPTLKSIEEEYGNSVNFIMVNGDDGRNWPLIQLFGVDAIPHLALLSDRGDVETALIGPMSRNVLRADIDALLAEKDCRVAVQEVAPKPEDEVCHDELPYVMYDAFGNRPESRRINFAEK
ncbi:hypothetical protein ACHAWO_012511 [Cyclotella atomus]|uniref:Thioredoxin domain-containing protein n=1 Tax=Cyclotella atomus TaxID=382360 RepID=A0ABD3Q179_9STRA